jgi:hypothetical protein
MDGCNERVEMNLTAATRKAIPASKFGLPGAKGNLSPASAAKIRAKANKVLGK